MVLKEKGIGGISWKEIGLGFFFFLIGRERGALKGLDAIFFLCVCVCVPFDLYRLKKAACGQGVSRMQWVLVHM